MTGTETPKSKRILNIGGQNMTIVHGVGITTSTGSDITLAPGESVEIISDLPRVFQRSPSDDLDTI